MQRPPRLFLVRVTHDGHNSYSLAWKNAHQLLRIPAGVSRRMGADSVITYEAADDAPPTAQSIVAELAASPDYAPSRCALVAWDVSEHVGRHHPRMRRGEIVHGRIDMPEGLTVEYCKSTAALASSVLAAKLLFDELETICTVIDPDLPQINAYGHRLRLLLISACTEVESAWRSVFVANTSAPPRFLTTKDYVRLAAPMKLRERRILFTRVTPARELAPFAAWDEAHPTKSLAWYDSYNDTKHNREMHLERATLGHIIDALAALYLMLVAQFGDEAQSRLPSHPYFVELHPEFGIERYIQSPFDDGPWRSLPLFG